MFWSVLTLLFFIFKPIVLADDTSISWSSGATSAELGKQFDINVRVTSVTAGTYYVRADDGSSCSLDLLYKDSWSNSCYVGNDFMQPITINDNNGSGEVILRLRVRSTMSAKNYALYSYVYDANHNKLSTSPSTYSITINNPTPTVTPTLTPTLIPTISSVLTPTLTPTPTKKLTPTPTEVPVMEPTEVPIMTIIPTKESEKITEEKSNSNYLPVIFIIFGLLMFTVPFLGPKIVAKFKFKKQDKPPIIPPFTGLTDQPLQ
jgi:hypothetical protein